MNINHLSIYLCLLQFMLSMSYTLNIQIFHLSVKFIFNYFIVYGIAIFIFSDPSLLLHRNASNFSMIFLFCNSTEFVDHI